MVVDREWLTDADTELDTEELADFDKVFDRAVELTVVDPLRVLLGVGLRDDVCVTEELRVTEAENDSLRDKTAVRDDEIDRVDDFVRVCDDETVAVPLSEALMVWLCVVDAVADTERLKEFVTERVFVLLPIDVLSDSSVVLLAVAVDDAELLELTEVEPEDECVTLPVMDAEAVAECVTESVRDPEYERL